MQTIILNNKPRLVSCASIAGKKENDGNMSEFFDAIILDGRYGKKSWEEAESEMQKDAAFMVLHKTENKPEDINFIFGGDLLNQCMGTSFGITKLNIPFFGIYGACSTFCEGLILASMCVDGGYGKKVMCTSSSHFCSSERQFRFPLEYGGQRAPAAQWTVTAAGAALVSDSGGDISITAVTPGKVIDLGISDASNMGAAMAPAAIDTIKTHFKDRGLKNNYFDMVVTGDLGKFGYSIAKEKLKEEGVDLSNRFYDCGAMIYKEEQDAHAGGSGCGCCASVFSGYIFDMLKQGKIDRVLLVATGALMSTTSSYQGNSIPSVAHAVSIERVRK